MITTYPAQNDKTAPAIPSTITALARTELHYEGGRFLTPSIIQLPQAEKDAITAWIVETGHPLGFEVGTVEWRIEMLVRQVGGVSPRDGGTQP